MNVYISLIADIFHAGHARLINESSKLGNLTIGLLSDKACSELGETPLLSYEKRKEVLSSIKGVSSIIIQEDPSYLNNLKKLKPDFVLHGDDWKNNHQKKFRSEVKEFLDKNGGNLIEIPYSYDVNPIKLKEQAIKNDVGSFSRNQLIKHLIKTKNTIRILEVHSPISALIAEKSKVEVEGIEIEYDGFWSSSLTDSTSKGKPDIEAVDISSRLKSIDDIFEVTQKPMIFDGDTGGKAEHLEFTVKSLERLGVGAIIIEDKVGLKKNSLFGNEVEQKQDSIENFCHKIKTAKKAQRTDDFLVIARIESLILDKGLDDAHKRAKSYVESGADGIMIHSRNEDGKEIIEFIEKFRKKDKQSILVVVPTSYNKIKFEQFRDLGVNVVIYANHLLRSAYPSMKKVAEDILVNGRSYESEKNCMAVKEILNLIPGTK
jgi:phosphoenolpyruvate phosphomutase / 2-hydroxyethylphosphonate cytidylyltransferase